MIGYYVIVRKSDDNVMESVSTKAEADAYSSETYDKVCWVPYYDGATPAVDSTFSESRSVDEQRRAAYIMRSDELFIAYQGQDEDGHSSSAYSAWTTERSAIKTEIPKS